MGFVYMRVLHSLNKRKILFRGNFFQPTNSPFVRLRGAQIWN